MAQPGKRVSVGHRGEALDPSAERFERPDRRVKEGGIRMTGNAIEHPFLTAGCEPYQFMMTIAREAALEYGLKVLNPHQHRIRLVKRGSRRWVVRHLQDHRVPENHVDHHHRRVGVREESSFGESSPDAWGDGGKLHAKPSMSSLDIAKEVLPGGGKFHRGCFTGSSQYVADIFSGRTPIIDRLAAYDLWHPCPAHGRNSEGDQGGNVKGVREPWRVAAANVST